MENLEEIRRRIACEPDFVYVPRYKFSLRAVVDRYPDGMPSRAAAAKAMLMTEEQFQTILDSAIAKLRTFF